MLIAKRLWVRGRVQGVYYRASTQQQARKLGICGHAKNLSDGRVEVLAAGEAEQIAVLIDWLWQGPPAADVTAIDEKDVALSELHSLPTEFLVA